MTGQDVPGDAVEIHPVTPDRLSDLADVFQSHGSTRGCWCMAFIVPRQEYGQGWGDGNRAHFEQMTNDLPTPMGLVAYNDDGTPVAWCAAGPRSRYQRAISPRATILKDRDASEDDDVWLVPCFFVRVGHRRQGTTRALLAAAIELAQSHGAAAIEGFPLANDNPTKLDEYYGRERRFAECGFRCVARPTPKRAVMRRDLKF